MENASELEAPRMSIQTKDLIRYNNHTTYYNKNHSKFIQKSQQHSTAVTVHSVLSNVAKIHSRLPVAMEFWLVCLGILAYSCQNTSRDSGVWTVTTLITIILIISKTIAIVNAFWYNQLYRYCYSVLSNITSAWMLLQIQNRNFLT